MDFAMQVVASCWSYGAVWCGIAWFYCMCATFLAYQAGAYFYIPAKATPLLGNLELLSIGVGRDYYRTIGSIYVAIAVVHVLSLLDMVVGSLWHRRLVFTSRTSQSPSLASRTVVHSFHWVVAALEPVLPPPQSRLRRFVRFIGRSALSLWRAFGVTNPNYGVVYITRELIQTGIQTYQAYRLSALVAREWMNQVIVVLLVLNCWATPIIQFTLHSSPGSTRLLCLFVNLALDFVSYIVFPVALFLPYYYQFNPEIGNYDQAFWYTDVWLIQVINEWQMLFVSSFWDAFSKFFIAYNITRSLRSIPRLLRCRDVAVEDRGSAPQASLVATDRGPVNAWAIAPAPIAPVQQVTSPVVAGPHKPSSTTTDTRAKWRRRIEHWGHRALALWGIVVLALHVQSAITSDNNQCLVQVRPWFTTQPVCSLMEINCYDGRLTGNESDFNHAIDSIQTDWLAYLIIRHCSAVEITARIHELPWLIALKVYNSTLVRWEDDAALTQTHNPQMLFVFMATIQTHALPPGLYSRDYPLKLYDIELADWNVTYLPDQIADVWPPGMFLVIEKFAFTEFPEALAKLRPGYLSISFNNFTEIPPLFWENDGLVFLNLNGNPITSLPSEPWTSQAVGWLCTVDTQLKTLPNWLKPSTVMKFMAGSTPFCSSLTTSNATALGISEYEIPALRDFVNCTPAEDYHYLTHYPLVDEAINNPSRIH